MGRLLAPLLLALLVGVVSAAVAPSTIDITVPESTKVEGEDAYICITKPLPDKPLKLVGVEPLAEQKVVHHILLFGECDSQQLLPEGTHADAHVVQQTSILLQQSTVCTAEQSEPV
jgi:hypothetical protein